ncbi:MAG: histidine kinase [Oxalicibacterium faecigallinarum]|uniref:Response regulatory domain-containing protein n=1 Tax=Oxalicibacterium faecigallinarum TaxID=573741 RepID=A0A8J3AW90_9BURK|nr:histidine kinase [Oxalicibacterium faecigallinarum]MDQ7970256.1 histidine kinase [Oxalicibacterium faecigallinarum]GGI21646.1 hypothetical protein GCM10008066_30090 [Oxalicibacterium faecigallinarum]
MSTDKHNILLVEKNPMIGSVIASTAYQLNLATVRKVTSLSAARQYLMHDRISALIANIDDEAADLAFLQALRDATFRAPSDLPVAIITPGCNGEFAEKLKALKVSRILLKPFKVRDVITTIELVTAPKN